MQENSSFNSESASQSASQSIQKEKATSFFMSLGVFAFVIVITVILYVLTFMNNNSVTANTENVETIKQEIATLTSDKKNSVAILIENNSIAESIHLTTLINSFAQIAGKYQVTFQNFSIKDDTISTNLIAKNSDKDAVQKIITMMNEFAKAGQQGSFSLEPIFSVSGDTATRTTPIVFKIVPKTVTPTETDESTGSGSENSSN